MKKLFTSIALAATMFGASAADFISAYDLYKQNPDALTVLGQDDSGNPLSGNYDGDYQDSDWKHMTYQASSGIVYNFDQVALTAEYFRFRWNYDCSSNVNAGSPDMWIESVTIGLFGYYQEKVLDSVMLYADENEVSQSNYNDAEFAYREYSVSPVDGELVINVNVPCHYFILSVPQSNIEYISVKWTDKKPVPVVEKPVIRTWNDVVEAGSNVSIQTPTLGATIHASVYLNDQLVPNQPADWIQEYSWESMSVALPGKAGDKVRVEAYASKDSWVDSETVTWVCESLAMAPAPNPSVTKVGSDDPWVSYILPGEQLIIAVNTTDADYNPVPLEGAKVRYTYGWEKWGDDSLKFESEEIVADAPVTVTVPDNAPEGYSFYIDAYANADGYRESNYTYKSFNIISSTLNAPEFSLKDGATVRAGGSLIINRPSHATEIHYTVNDGEEQVSEEYNVTITVTEEITVVAWATGEAPFQPSEKVTVTVGPEKFEPWMDVITHSTFGVGNDDTDTSAKIYPSVLKNDATGVEYEYRGGFWPRTVDNEEINSFYFYGKDYKDYTYLRNTLPGVDNATNEEVPVKTVQIDSYQSQGFFLFLSDTPIEITNGMTDYSYASDGTTPLRITVVGNYNVGENYPDHFNAVPGEMINLDQFQEMYGDEANPYNNKKYFAIVPVMANQGYYLTRAIIGYTNNVGTGVTNVAADALDGVNAIYNLNGMKMNAENLKPGVYVRIADGKATKIIVK